MKESIERETRQFWLPTELFRKVKKIQKEYDDERPTLTVRRLLRAAIAHREELDKEKKESSD